jgi:hypothetical protein
MNTRIIYRLIMNSLKIVSLTIFSCTVFSKTPLIEIRIKDHLFFPSEIVIPVETKIKLLVINEDETAEEFESYELNREKIIMGGSKAIIFIGPLKTGRYPFFGEFYPKTAQGVIIAQ